MKTELNIQFLGGAQTVTGSKHLVTSGKHRFLVDCGLFQGIKELRLKNRAPLPIDPKTIDAVLLTHAHLDHSGYLPVLVKTGFRGRIYCSRPTRELCRIILSDSARLQEEDADFANRKGFSRHHPAKPLYQMEDVEKAMDLFRVVDPHEWEKLPGNAQFRLSPSSHILGSTFIELEINGAMIVFSGDLGRQSPLLYDPPTRIEHADYLVVESTYGDRLHKPDGNFSSTTLELAELAESTFARGGQLIIPSFAVGRTQEILLLIAKLRAQGRLLEMPVYLDTPMGTNATQIFCDYPDWSKLSPEESEALWKTPRIVRSQQESIEIMRQNRPAILIAGSGMAAGGRVLHHLASRLPDERNAVALVGFQAAGTRGRLLRDGISEVKIHGRYIPVHARIQEISGLSAHADQAETIAWLGGFTQAPRRLFITHGEPQASDALRVRVRDALGWEASVPAPLETVSL